MAFDKKVYATSKKYTDDSIEGTAGVIAGKNCTIDSITDITGGHRITFKWTADNGDVRTATMDVMDGDKGDTGLGIKAVAINSSNHLIVTFDDDTTDDAGELTDLNTSFAHITDIDLNNLQNGQTLQYNATSQTWQNVNPGSVSTDLGDLNDVDLNNLTDGQIIVWDATDSKWKNATNDVTALAGRVTAIESVIPSTATTSNKVATASDIPDVSNFITNTVDNLVNYYTKSQTYTQAEVDALISAVVTLDIAVVNTLPTENISTTTIYLVPSADPQTQNVKDEYINTTGTSAGWELIGSTAIDLTGYVTTTALTTALADYVLATDLATTLSGYVQKSSTAGLLKNDGTVDTVAKASQADLTAVLDGVSIDSFGDVETALTDKVDKVSGKALSTNDYDNTAKGKLDALSNIQQIGAGLTLDNETHELSATGISITIDNEMSASSTNPVQNKVITAALGNKVDTVSGKGLSTNDYTNADKDIVDGVTTALSGKVDKNGTDSLMTADEHTKLSGIATGAEVNTIESISLNGTAITPDANKNVALTVITKAVNDLTNYYLKTETYTKTEVDSLVGAISTISFEVVSSLPTTNIQTNVIYLVPKSTAQTSNIKDEYINLDGTSAGWEKIGDTEIDLSGYVTTTALNTALADYTTTTDLTTLLAGKADASTVSAILDGQSIDSFADVETALGGKADKVVSAVNGNFAGLDANGNLTDSGSKASDFVAASAGEAGDTVVTFTDPQADGTITSGSALKTIIGLIKYKLAHIVSGHTIVNSSGTSQTARTKLKFTGSATVTDDSENDQTIVNITGGGSGGHTIENSSGTAMTQRADLQFVGATVTDDSTNNRTVVTATAASVGAVATSNIDTTGTYTTDDTKVISAKNFANLKTATSAKRYQILYNSGWSQVSVSGTTYYRYTLTLTYATGGVPKIDIAEGSAAIPTTAEKAAWDLIEYCTVDDSTYKTVYLYAKTQPTSNFYVRVWGCGGEL